MSLELPCTSCVEHGRSPSLCIKLSKGELETQMELAPTTDNVDLDSLLLQLNWKSLYVPKTPIPTLPRRPHDFNIDPYFMGTRLALQIWEDPSADDALRLATIAIRVRSVEGNEYREAALCLANKAFDNIFRSEREGVHCAHIVAANLDCIQTRACETHHTAKYATKLTPNNMIHCFYISPTGFNRSTRLLT